jgi:hypothetical protein
MVIFSESMHWHSSDSATARNGKLPLLHMFLFCLKGKKKVAADGEEGKDSKPDQCLTC